MNNKQKNNRMKWLDDHVVGRFTYKDWFKDGLKMVSKFTKSRSTAHHNLRLVHSELPQRSSFLLIKTMIWNLPNQITLSMKREDSNFLITRGTETEREGRTRFYLEMG